MVRVVFLTHNYPRWPGDYSGAAVAVLARALVRRGVSVRVVAMGGEDAAERIEQDGIPIRRVRIPSRLGQTVFDQDAFAARLRSPRRWELLLRLRRRLRLAAEREVSAGADLVHAHWWMPSGWAAPPRVPQVLTLQGTDAGLIRSSRLARAAARRLLGRTTLITAVSRSIGETFQNVTGRFVGTEHVHPLPIESRGRPWTRGGSGAVMMARLDAAGRVGLALETIALLASRGHKLPLTVIGEGRRRDALQQQARHLGVSELVRFVGGMPPDQALGHLARADLMLLTTQGEHTVAHTHRVGQRSPEQLTDIREALRESGFWYAPEYGEVGDHGLANADWGIAFLTPEWLLAKATPDWRVAAFHPGRVEGNQDLYVLERR